VTDDALGTSKRLCREPEIPANRETPAAAQATRRLKSQAEKRDRKPDTTSVPQVLKSQCWIFLRPRKEQTATRTENSPVRASRVIFVVRRVSVFPLTEPRRSRRCVLPAGWREKGIRIPDVLKRLIMEVVSSTIDLWSLPLDENRRIRRIHLQQFLRCDIHKLADLFGHLMTRDAERLQDSRIVDQR
jgi:hypothetical protein